MTLPRSDQSEEGYGVHHGTALVACQIIGNNAFNKSRLALDQKGEHPVNLPFDDVLTHGEYYFVVDGPYSMEEPYPVVASFQDWACPGQHQIPATWPYLTRNYDPSPGQEVCGITRYRTPLEGAHLVPKEQGYWYILNGMSAHSSYSFADINHGANIVPLRKDIHSLFDARAFGIVPKNGVYVSHIFSQKADQYWPDYHHVRVTSLDKEARSYLFARFAWTILFHVKKFVTANESRIIVQVTAKKRGDTPRPQVTRLSGAVLYEKYIGGGSRESAVAEGKKPPKRSRTDENLEDDDDEDSEDSRIQAIVESVYFWGQEGDDPNRRQWPSDSTAPTGDDDGKGKEMESGIDEPGDKAM